MSENQKVVSEWPACSLEKRLRDCLFMLSVHGIIPDAEEEKAKQRIRKLITERAAKGEQ